VSPTVLPSVRRPPGLQGRHVLIVFLAFFGAVFAVNGGMIYWALSTHTGLVANEPYRKGLHYNDRIAAAERQARLGWTDSLDVDRDGRIAVMLADSDGRPVSGLEVEARIGRPATDRHDINLKFTETAPGRYDALAVPLGRGSWLVALDVRTDRRAADPVYRARRRLWLKP